MSKAKGDIVLAQADAASAYGLHFGMVLADDGYERSADFCAELTARVAMGSECAAHAKGPSS